MMNPTYAPIERNTTLQDRLTYHHRMPGSVDNG